MEDVVPCCRVKVGRTERIDRNDRRCAHVVHEAETVADLVRDDIAEGVAQDFVRKFRLTDLVIDRGGLYEPPFVDQPHDVVIDIHRSVQDFAAAGIDP